MWGRDSLDMCPEQQRVFLPEMDESETKPFIPLEKLLDMDSFTKLLDHDQFYFGYETEFEEPKPSGETKEELKDLRDSVVPLSQKLEALHVSSSWKGTLLPAIVTGLDPLVGLSIRVEKLPVIAMVQRPPGAWQTSPLAMHLPSS